MALPSTLYRFRIELSDVDRGVYENLDFRIAQHPSETQVFLVTRVLAYALSFSSELEFSPGGLSDVDAPALQSRDSNGGFAIWIEIGNPSARKLHKASKAAREVKVYTYKAPELLLNEMRGEKIHRAEEIEIYSFAPAFLEKLTSALGRDNRWTILHTEGSLVIGIGDLSLQSEVTRHSLF